MLEAPIWLPCNSSLNIGLISPSDPQNSLTNLVLQTSIIPLKLYEYQWSHENRTTYAEGHSNRWGPRRNDRPRSGQRRLSVQKEVVIGKRLGGHDHKVDVLVSGESDVEIPISLEWQQTSGTAEQKVPFEILCLAEAVHGSRGKFKKAYLVLGGGGWTLRDYYVSGDIRHYLRNCEPVEILSLETFVPRANQGRV